MSSESIVGIIFIYIVLSTAFGMMVLLNKSQYGEKIDDVWQRQSLGRLWALGLLSGPIFIIVCCILTLTRLLK